jgi:HEPN domain-containing protein
VREYVLPLGPRDFESLMLHIDKSLAQRGVSIPVRPGEAVGEVGKLFRIPMPLGDPGASNWLTPYWPVAKRIFDWYAVRYGDKLKIDWCVGRCVIDIGDDLWVMRLPLVFGSVHMTADPTIESRPSAGRNDQPTYNVLDAIVGMTNARSAELTLDDRVDIFARFELAMGAYGVLNGSSRVHKLIELAKADAESAVVNLAGPHPQYGLSKWSSLQASEKAMKAAIELAGGTFSNTHDLTKLASQANRVGVQGKDWPQQIAAIQCEAGVRYGEKSVDKPGALAAHISCLQLIAGLPENGAKLYSDMKLTR